MVVFDTSTILYVLEPQTRPPIDPATQLLLTRCPDRIALLIAELSTARTGILIPTPVLSEFMVKAGPNKHQYLTRFKVSKNFTVASFDEMAAIELALLNDPDLQSSRALDPQITKAKIKFDRQVVAIAKVHGAKRIITDDGHLAMVAQRNGIVPTMTWQLPLPPEKPENKQMGLFKNGDQETGPAGT